MLRLGWYQVIWTAPSNQKLICLIPSGCSTNFFTPHTSEFAAFHDLELGYERVWRQEIVLSQGQLAKSSDKQNKFSLVPHLWCNKARSEMCHGLLALLGNAHQGRGSWMQNLAQNGIVTWGHILPWRSHKNKMFFAPVALLLEECVKGGVMEWPRAYGDTFCKVTLTNLGRRGGFKNMK